MGLHDMYDYRATRDQVYEVVNSFKILRLKLKYCTPYFTNEMKLAFSPTTVCSDPTGKYGEWQAGIHDEYDTKLDKIMQAFNKLYDDDRKLIRSLLFEQARFKTSDEVMYEFGYSRDCFLVAKKEAIIRFGIALGIEVEKPV